MRLSPWVLSVHILFQLLFTIIPHSLVHEKQLCMEDYKYLSWVYGVDRKFCHEGHWSASWGLPRCADYSDLEWWIFSIYIIHPSPHPPERYFFLHTFWFTTFDFQSRTCCLRLPFKSFYWSWKKSTLPVTAFRLFTLTSNLHIDVIFWRNGCKNQSHLTT